MNFAHIVPHLIITNRFLCFAFLDVDLFSCNFFMLLNVHTLHVAIGLSSSFVTFQILLLHFEFHWVAMCLFLKTSCP
jgi:hypothetical protein